MQFYSIRSIRNAANRIRMHEFKIRSGATKLGRLFNRKRFDLKNWSLNRFKDWLWYIKILKTGLAGALQNIIKRLKR